MATSNEATFIKIVKEMMLPKGFIFNSDIANEAYKRLFEHPDALKAWNELYGLDDEIKCDCENHSEEDKASNKWWSDLPKIERWSFFAIEFSQIFKHCFIVDSDRITKAEIKKSANEVYSKARELAQLINRNSALLNITLSDCMRDDERESFVKAAELMRDNYDKNRYPNISATHYLNIAHHNNMLNQDLRDILWVFATKAKETENAQPIKPNPRSNDLEARLFCENLCSLFKTNYGQPLTYIAASFASAIFDKVYSNDTVKSWWSRSN